MVRSVVYDTSSGLSFRRTIAAPKDWAGLKGALHTSDRNAEPYEWGPLAVPAPWPCLPFDCCYFVGLPRGFRSCTNALAGARGDGRCNPRASGPNASGDRSSVSCGGGGPNARRCR